MISGYWILALLTLPLQDAVKPNKPSQPPVQVEMRPSVADSQIAVLKAQLESAKEYRADLIGTVYWALGGLAGITIVLIGYSWFANWRGYERDRIALKRELSSELKGETTKFAEELQAQTRNAQDELSKTATASAEKTIAGSIAALTSRISALDRKVRELEYAKVLWEGRYWSEIKEVPANAILQYRDLLLLGVASNTEHEIFEALAAIRVTLEQKPSMFAHQIADLSEVLGALPSKFSDEVGRIQSVLADVPRY